jgi:hypothetical protein
MLLRLTLDDQGTTHLLWAVRNAASTAEVDLYAATRPRSGAWSPAVGLGTAGYGGALYFSAQADLATAPNGTSIVAFCRGGTDNALDFSHPATVSVRTAAPGGPWSAPQALWTGQWCDGVRTQLNRSGDALTSWYNGPAELDDSEMLTSLRPAGGAWPSPPRTVPELSGSGTDRAMVPVLDDAGAVRLFAGISGNLNTTVLRYAELPAGGGAESAPEVLPLPTLDETGAGWVGVGPLNSYTYGIDGSGRSVTLFGTDVGSAPQGGAGTSGLWAGTRSPESGWSLAAVDALADASDPAGANSVWDPSLDAGAGGTLTATWTSLSLDASCSHEVFRAVRGPGGTWSRRMLSAVQRGSAESVQGTGRNRVTICNEPPVLQTTGTPASLLWTAHGHTFEVTAARPVPAGPAPLPRVRLKTSTWRAIRKAGAIEFTCGAAGIGFCHLSLIPAERDVAVLDAIEGFCRPAVGVGRVARRGRTAVIRFPLAAGCYDGGPLPHLSNRRLRVPILAAFDAVGRSSTSRRSIVTIGPR